MTDQQINQAIAKACGIVGKDQYGPLYQTPEGWVVDCPQFATCLNAMAEAEKTIFPYYATVYANKLARVTKADYSDDTEYFCATARQRAEAFLKALGKWEPTTEESSAVQSTASGGASTYGGKGLPPETQITVNGKTFCLADIDKEMTE